MKGKPLFVLFITIFIDLLGFGIIIPILPIYAKELGAADYVVGLVGAIFSFMQLLCAPLLGSLSDRVGRKPIILTSLLINIVGYTVFANAMSLALLFLSRILSGIGSANLGAAQAYISDITKPENRAKSFGIIGAAFGLGFIFGPPIGGLLKDSYGIEAVGYGAVILCIINFLVVVWLLPESLKEKDKTARIKLNPFADMGTVLKDKVIGQLILINLIFITAFSMMHIAASLMWEEHYNLDEKNIGYLFMYIGFTSALFQGTIVGWFTKKVGEAKMMLLGTISMAVGLGTMAFAPEDYFVFAELSSIAFIAFGNAMLMPSITSLVSSYADPKSQGKILGINQSIGSLARTIGFIFSGSLYGVVYFLPFVTGSAIMIIVLAMVVVFTRRLKTATTA